MTRRRVPALILAWLVVSSLVVTACGTGQASGTVGPGNGGSSAGEGTLPPIGESLEPEDTGPPSTGIPGYDGWLSLNPAVVDIGSTLTGFAMTLTKRAEWLGGNRGALFYTTMGGDFRLTGTIRAVRTSDSSQNPSGDGVQLAGLMARRVAEAESWVMLAVGANGPDLVTVTASTTDGGGEMTPKAWSDNEADLKLCRVGTTFTFWRRAADSDDDWVEVGRLVRADLGGSVQVGTSLSANATPDLTSLVDNLTLEPMEAGEAC